MNKIIKIFLAWLMSFIVLFGLIFADIRFNPWIKELKLEWYNFFTTSHYMTVLYLSQPQTVIFYIATLSAFLVFLMVYWKIYFFSENKILEQEKDNEANT